MHYINSKLILIITILIIVISSTLADYKDPTTKVNINQKTDLFDKSVNNWSGLQQQLNADKDSAIKGGGSADITFLAGKNANELQAESINLNNIKAIDLNDRGRKQMLKENIIDDLYIDESKPLNEEHFQDAKRLATGQDKLLANLLEKLKELGVDCKAEKGLKEVEPTYYMQVEQKQHKDTKYNKTTCEELRNQYKCTDELKVKCTRTGPRYGEWQFKTIRFGGWELHNNKMNWGFAQKTSWKNWDWLISPNHPQPFRFFGSLLFGDDKQVDSPWYNNPAAIIGDARVFIAGKVGASLEQIREDVVFPPAGRGIGAQGNGPRWRKIWDEYEFGYWYRDIYQVCEQWNEDWTENCRLQ